MQRMFSWRQPRHDRSFMPATPGYSTTIMGKLKGYGSVLNDLLCNKPGTESGTLNQEPGPGKSEELHLWALVNHESVETTELNDLAGEISAEQLATNQSSKNTQPLLSVPTIRSKAESTNLPSHGKPFPPEIWYYIIECAAFASNKHKCSDAAGYASGKVKMHMLQNLASLSKFHRRVVLECWARTLHLLEQHDIVRLQSITEMNGVDVLRCVRRLVCEDNYEIYRAPKSALSAFHFLDELVLVCHKDINFGSTTVQVDPGNGVAPINNGDQAQSVGSEHQEGDQNVTYEQAVPQPRMSYRKLLVKLPSTLRSLKIYASHVPDIFFIQKVAEDCPLMRALTLARCTIFTCVQCRFWKQLPRTESDAYFSSQGAAAYASALGKEIKRIKNLEEISIGVYLTDHSAIDVHLTQHAGLDLTSEGDLGSWEQPCQLCVSQYLEATLQLEREATAILAKENAKLLKVSWASFCSNRRTGWSSHDVIRGEKNEFQGLSTPSSSQN